ncbi:hypothetical protein CR158_05270 [Halomonas heilongjiangensis]|uniref:YchF C-terminal domain-containing protein n=1 Tax=Halomonas heilongjiangensis TaxID=1387883 RepID=A0A2N7TNE8_9GAMM|nr:hypothetical protein C1H66_09630 [Halomonas heilongjiangensis]PXX93095.1 hypothetical protein CR158_05270 [Halomonas heilongjiangensis]
MIRTDLARGLISAEVVSHDDFIADKSEQGAKDVGRFAAGRQGLHIVRDEGVIHLRCNV